MGAMDIEFAGVANQRVANVLCHLDCHTGIVEANDEGLWGNAFLQ